MSESLVNATLHSALDQTVDSQDKVPASQDAMAQNTFLELPFFISDDNAESVSDASLGLSLGDTSGLEDFIDRYWDTVTTYTPLTQFTPNLACPTQEGVTFYQVTQLCEESHIIASCCGDSSCKTTLS